MRYDVQKAKELEAKAKAIRREEKRFWKEVELRQMEIEEFFVQKKSKAPQGTEPFSQMVLGARPKSWSHDDSEGGDYNGVR